MIHGSQLIEASKNAGVVLAILTAGLKIGGVHLCLNRSGNCAEFIWRASVNGETVGAQVCVSFLELVAADSLYLENLACSMLGRWDRLARAAGS